MTELELYLDKLVEALQDKDPLMLLRRVRNNAVSAVALAEANSVLTESDKLLRDISVNNSVLTSADASSRINRALSFICLKELSNLYKNTTAYANGLIDNHCRYSRTPTTEDKQAIVKLHNLSEYLKQNVLPLLLNINEAKSLSSKQHMIRNVIMSLDKIKR